MINQAKLYQLLLVRWSFPQETKIKDLNKMLSSLTRAGVNLLIERICRQQFQCCLGHLI